MGDPQISNFFYLKVLCAAFIVVFMWLRRVVAAYAGWQDAEDFVGRGGFFFKISATKDIYSLNPQDIPFPRVLLCMVWQDT